MGYSPLMTETGILLLPGADFVSVSELVLSPSLYYSGKVDKNGKRGFNAIVFPIGGGWLEYETE